MTISKNILSMSAEEFAAWIQQRRTIQPQSTATARRGKRRQKTVTQLAKELGIDKHKVLEALNENQNPKD